MTGLMRWSAAIAGIALSAGLASAQSRYEPAPSNTAAEDNRPAQVSREQVERFNERLRNYQQGFTQDRVPQGAQTAAASDSQGEPLQPDAPAPSQQGAQQASRGTDGRLCTVSQFGAVYPILPEPSPFEMRTVLLRMSCNSPDDWGYRIYQFEYQTADEESRTIAAHFQSVILTAIESGNPVYITYREEWAHTRFAAVLTGVNVVIR